MTPATAVTYIHRSADVAGFRSWARDMPACAAGADGHLSGRVAACDDPRPDWAVAVEFCDEDRLTAWLDLPTRATVLDTGQFNGFCCSATDLVIGTDGTAPPGVGVFRHAVAEGRDADFRNMQVQLATAAANLPGYLGTALVPADRNGEWMSIVRFRTGAQLTEWMRSAERTAVLSGLRSTLA
ncbi:antibiotic biosynthesis monooxygenase [Mycolicibacterium xanthum]|uniref:antibiotic biosynthesis monooxygenase n=1 Tax=Mycolicibacterium xanthum TaxID=2796469 RepID=UPI002107ABC0|nr:antibiotic biosynthesis monooxygenase [Mycolicibacterium xanthum]